VTTLELEEPSKSAWGDQFDHVVERTTGLPSLRLHELRSFRELLYFLTWRDIKVRYKQTALGVVWAILQPVLAMVLFTVVFSNVAKISSGAIPYPIFSYSALVPWLLFANAVTLASLALTVNPTLITRVYFPRLFLVASPVLAGLVDFALAMVVLIGLMIYYGIAPNAVGTLLLAPFLLLALLSTFGVSAWLAAVNVKYRDVRFAVPFMMQVWLFATPVIYPISRLGQPWRTIYGVNPMASVVDGFRWALAGGPRPALLTIALSVVSGLTMFVAGVVYFQHTQKKFADVI
jgi:lipopolysaccharide transport system permease protein